MSISMQSILPQKNTPEFEAFLSPARAQAQIWKTLIGVVVIGGWYLLTSLLLLMLFLAAGFDMATTEAGVTRFTPAFLGMALATLAVLPLCLIPLVKLLHRRSFVSLIGPHGFLKAPYLAAAFLVFLLTMIGFLIDMLIGDPVRAQSLGTVALWAVPILVLLVLQTAAEELVFRGYLLQQLAARFDNRLIWWVLPSLLFGAMHYSPSSFGQNAWIAVAIATLMGLVLSDITIRSGNLSAAMGVHFANNVFAIFILSLPGELSGLSLYHLNVDMTDPDAVRRALLTSFCVLLGIYAVYLAVLRWRRG